MHSPTDLEVELTQHYQKQLSQQQMTFYDTCSKLFESEIPFSTEQKEWCKIKHSSGEILAIRPCKQIADDILKIKNNPDLSIVMFYEDL